MRKTPTALSGTSPKSDMETLNNNKNTSVGFGGGRRGSGAVARRRTELVEVVESLRGRNSAFEPRESERQVDGLFESLLSENFGE
jgi:hypothetical protein